MLSVLGHCASSMQSPEMAHCCFWLADLPRMAVHEDVLALGVCVCRHAGLRHGCLFPAAAGLEVGYRFGLCSADVRLPAVPGRPQQSRQQSTLPRCQSGDIAVNWLKW